MRILKRRKIIREFIEARLAKNQRRMQSISEESYKLRLQLEALDALPANKPLTKEEREAQAKAAEEAAAVVDDIADHEIGVTPVEGAI